MKNLTASAILMQISAAQTTEAISNQDKCDRAMSVTSSNQQVAIEEGAQRGDPVRWMRMETEDRGAPRHGISDVMRF